MDKEQDELKKQPDSKLVTTSTNESTSVAVKAKDSETTSSSNFTSQKQLLALAKQFVLDGALIPEDKQMPLEERVIKRERLSRLRQQKNLEAIIQKSLSYCPNNTSATKADPDWFNRFTNLAEDISNATMQDLWAKILAGEISHPGSFSLKSLTVFKSMSITDAKLLAKVCSIAVKDSSKKNIRIITGSYSIPGILSFFSKSTQCRVNLNQCGLTYTEILSLADNHLIFMQEAESNELQKGEKMVFNFNGNNLTITAKKKQCGLSFYKFTPIGSELASLISDNPNKELVPLLQSSLQAHFSVS